ncbi:Trifunctional nucleotide phosphoesterase protein YfkN precursor [Thiorhodovibrio winogradskyi]|uniref:Trifunctional nucleotide phosphoesterase protein YfkN n=1 Tax=Thiorhodovibrio winogradskyi TaxID=77007 RepID=A0ABZ0SF93_9GAMM|nr:choice-of-anchor I family protein [Thiorhodovibrio winogradskyi]
MSDSSLQVFQHPGLSLNLIHRFDPGSGEAGAESVVAESNVLFVTNGADARIEIFSPGIEGSLARIDLSATPGFDDLTSVAAKNGLVAVAIKLVDSEGNLAPGKVAIYDASDLGDIRLLEQIEVGFLPDMLTFSEDGKQLYVAIEGEAVESVATPGGVTIIDLPTDYDGSTVPATATFVGFSEFDSQIEALRAQGVRIFPGEAPSTDFEPEYIAIDPTTGDLLVTLQEANTVARIDPTAKTVLALYPMGIRDHSQDGNGLDPSDRDDGINIANWPVFGMPMPDAIATFQVDGQTYYITANEGDARDLAENEARIKDLTLDPTAFPDAATLQEDENLGRLQVSTFDGDTDNDGDQDALFSYGSRSFSIYDADGNLVFDSGDHLEQLISARAPWRFNNDDGEPIATEGDNRSDAKGPEPEAVAVLEVEGRVLAFIGLERDSGVAAYDVTDPRAPVFLDYIDGFAAGDIAPETIAVINAQDSGTGNPQIAIAYEGSGTTSVYDINQAAYSLELLHLTDQEAAYGAIEDAPRLSGVLNALKAQDLGNDGMEDNTLVLSSGDAIIPGLFFSASADVYGEAGVADILIQNELGVQAIAFGNHEFDFGTEFLASLIDGSAAEDFSGTAMPYLSGNLDFSTDPNLAGLVVSDAQAPRANSIAASTYFEVGGEKIGVLGATTPTLASISSPGTVGIQPAGFSTNPTPEDLDALAAVIQADVDALLAAHPDMDKVILLAHMQQISIEQELATRLSDVDIIVAGGSNTRLFDGNDSLRAGDTDQGPYPIFTTDSDGNPIAVVNTDGSYKYLGRLVIDFDANGHILPGSYDPTVSGAYATDAAGLAALDAESLIDPDIQNIANAIEDAILAKESNVFGLSEVFLNGNRSGGSTDGVRTQETNLGNLTADANLAIANQIAVERGETEAVVLSIKNGGGIRASIGQTVVPPGGTEAQRLPNEEIPGVKPAGGISENDIATTLAFNNGLTLMTLTGAEIAALFEHGIGGLPDASGRFPQISGAKFSFDPDAPAGERLINASLFDDKGDLLADLVRDGELVEANANATFRVVTLNFLAEPRFDDAGNYIGGGDGYPFPNTNTDPSVGAVADPSVVARINLVQLAEDDTTTADGNATFAPDGSEQDALAEYLYDNFMTTPYAEADVEAAWDTRIRNIDPHRGDASTDPGDGTLIKGVSVLGGDGDNLFVGSAGDDIFEGGAGNDSFTGLGDQSGDFFYGGDGIDIAVFRGVLADYSISASDAITDLRGGTEKLNGLVVVDQQSGRDGTDYLVGTERLAFEDVSLAFDIDGSAGQAYRLYEAAFGRTPDLTGIGHFIGQLDAGVSLTQIAQSFIDSAEFFSRNGANPNNAEFITAIYANILDRAPDTKGLAFWDDALENGLSRAHFLVNISESAESQENVIELIGSGIQYLDLPL